ncbi:MAG TPA: WYL domain-containing protein [Coriobacteriia bacterium]
MADVTRVRVTGPVAAELLRAVHRVRDLIEADLPLQRHLTQALASAAGVPAAAARWRVDSPLPPTAVMTAVHTALEEGRALTVDHLRQDGQVRPLTVEPCHVRLESGYWYLLCRVIEDGQERALRLDKVLSAEPGEPVEPRPIDLDRFLGGVFVPADPGLVAKVRFGPRSAVYAAERWGDGRSLPTGGIELDIPFQREHFLVRTLAEFGSDYEVMEPKSLRDGVRARAVATLESYEPDQPA